jgi:uncharacterized RDD family membrane protein YckC
MKKQIIYPKFISRLFSTTLDFILLSIIVTPIMRYVSRYIFILVFKNFLTIHNIYIRNYIDIASVTQMKEFMQNITGINLLYYSSLIVLCNVSLTGAYFILFWIYRGATPGKMILNFKIVDSETMDNATKYQLIKRFFGCFLAPIGILFILFTKRNQALHDKIASTVVIKR